VVSYLPSLRNALPPCLIGLEACSGAHYWAREFEKLGHQVRIIALKFIEPYRKGGKNDNNDAEAICEAVCRPNIWFVPVKSADQQAALCVHRVRQGVVRDRTAWVNRLRGLLAEFGIVLAKGRYAVQSAVPAILGDEDNGLPQLAREMIHDLWLSVQQANEQVLSYDRALGRIAREDETAKRLLTIPGVGEQIATGVVASAPDPRLFKNSRQFAAWLGLVPRQYTTGGKDTSGANHKTRGQIPAHVPGAWSRAVVANLGDKQASGQLLGQRPDRAPWPFKSRGCSGGA
jgi:transposase